MDWESHDRWAEKFGISREVSRYVNRIIDKDDRDELPANYREWINKWTERKAEKDGAKHGNSALHLKLKRDIKEKHDKGAGTKTADTMAGEATTQFLQQKGEDYLAAYYLHHHLDYLSENRNTGKTLQQLTEEHRNSGSKPFNSKTADFLLKHSDKLRDELNF